MAAASLMTTAIVTGGASGLGRATALCLARRGMGVVVADVRNDTPFEHDYIRYAETDVSFNDLLELELFPAQINIYSKRLIIDCKIQNFTHVSLHRH